jgi:metal-responsive CopG/Arc/MetJ family transcriptional regulator
MRTVQLTLDEGLVAEVDRLTARRGTTRSAFARQALREALARAREKEMEERHRQGYLRKPVKPSEFGPWEREQAWGEK